MSDKKNRNLGQPKAFDLYDVKPVFPQQRPIFWAGEQDTNNPDNYVEPNKVPPNLSLMSIPQAIRFIVGGNDVQSNINLFTYLGYMNMETLISYAMSDEQACGVESFNLRVDFGIRSAYTEVVNIVSDFGSSMGSQDIVNLKTEVAKCVKNSIQKPPEESLIFSQIQFGNGDYKTEFGAGFTCVDDPTLHYVPSYDWIVGSIGNVGPSPILTTYDLYRVTCRESGNQNTIYGTKDYQTGIHFFLKYLKIGDFSLAFLYLYLSYGIPGPLADYESYHEGDMLTSVIIGAPPPFTIEHD